MLGAKVRNKVKSEARKVKNLRCHLKFNVYCQMINDFFVSLHHHAVC